jgi:hypothetical protein
MENTLSRRSKVLTAATVAFGAFFLFAPSAHADIFEIEAATSCPGSVGGGLCNGGNPFSLGSLLGGGISVGSGTEKFVVTDNVGTFSFVFTGSAGDNGSCQINGGAASFFSSCSGVNNNGTSFSKGHDLTGGNGTFPPTTITFTAIPGAFSSCSSLAPCNFDLGFVSMQGLGLTVPSVPEPSALTLLALGLGVAGAFVSRRRRIRG